MSPEYSTVEFSPFTVNVPEVEDGSFDGVPAYDAPVARLPTGPWIVKLAEATPRASVVAVCEALPKLIVTDELAMPIPPTVKVAVIVAWSLY